MKKKTLLAALIVALAVAAPVCGTNMPFVNAAGSGVSSEAEITMGSLVVTADRLNVRSGAGLTYDKLTEVHESEIYRYIDVQDGWYRIVTDDHTTGWVRGIYVEASPSSKQPVSIVTSDYIIEDGVLVKYRGDESKIIIPDVVTAIGNYAFKGRTDLKQVVIPDTVTVIGNGAFYGCTGLTEVDLPASVTSIGDYAFNGCTGMKKVTIPNSVKTIGDYAFFNCGALTGLKIPNSVKSIGEFAFQSCCSLESVQIPKSVTSLGKGAFSNCESLKSVVLPSSLSSINDLTFAYCYKLANITIPKSVTSVGKYAFASCVKLGHVYYTGSQTEWNNVKVNNQDNANDYLFKARMHYSSVVGTQLKITTQPVNQVVLMGGKVVFTVAAQGDDVQYQWQLSDDGGKTWRNSQTTGTTYQTTLTKKNVNRCVRCVVTDKVGYLENSNVVSMKLSPLTIIERVAILTVANILYEGDSYEEKSHFTLSATGMAYGVYV